MWMGWGKEESTIDVDEIADGELVSYSNSKENQVTFKKKRMNAKFLVQH